MPRNRKVSDRKYNISDKGRARHRKYNISERGRVRSMRWRYDHTQLTIEKIWKMVLSGYKNR